MQRNRYDRSLISRDRWKWSEVRARIIARDRGICQLCSGLGAEVDHILPRALGGTDHPSNLRLLCKRCHTRRRERDAEPQLAHGYVTSETPRFPMHDCRPLGSASLPALRGDTSLGRWSGDGCPPDCPQYTAPRVVGIG